MSEDQIEKLQGRLSALELLMVINELSSLKGASREEVIEAAKSKAKFWAEIVQALEDDDSIEVDGARTKAFEGLGNLLVHFAGPIADHAFGDDTDNGDS